MNGNPVAVLAKSRRDNAFTIAPSTTVGEAQCVIRLSHLQGRQVCLYIAVGTPPAGLKADM